MDLKTLSEHRRSKDRFFARDPASPLAGKVPTGFTGLSYFEPNPDLIFVVNPEPADGKEIRVATSDEREKVYTEVCNVRLTIDSTPARLTLYDTGHPGLFLPFRDATSGVTTYGAGRYLDIGPNDDGSLTIDFNYAYNPYCVYSDGYSCPIPPVENWMTVAIDAGEKDFK